MNSSRKKSEQFFTNLTAFIIRFRLPVFLFMIICTAILGAQLRFLTMNTSNEGFLRKNDPILAIYNDFRDQFGRDDMLVIAIHSENIFTEPFLKRLVQLHETIRDEVPFVNEVTSMVNARSTRGEGDVLLVDDLLAKFPEDKEAFIKLREQMMENPLYLNQLISVDGKFTTMIIESQVYGGDVGEIDLLGGFDEPDSKEEIPLEYLTDKENGRIVTKTMALAKEYQTENDRIFLAGTPVVTHTIKQFMMKDMKKFLRLAVLLISLCLFLMFRRISGVILPLLVVALSLIATLGTMSLFGVQFKTPTIILPSFLLAVGVGASVHVLSLVYQNMRKGMEKNEAITASYAHSGVAIVMTSLTTAAGLASFGAAKVAPIGDLGIFSAIGVLIALLYTLILLPALLALIPLKKKLQMSKNQRTVMGRLIDHVVEFSVERYRLIIIISGILLVLGATGAMRLHFSHNILNWLPVDLDVRTATETIDENLRGSVVLEVVLDTGKENGVYDRSTLIAIDALAAELELYKDHGLFVGKVNSVATIIKEINQALNGNDPSFYKIPDNPKLIPQEFLLFENSGSDDLEDVVDSQFRKTRITIKVPWDDALAYVPFIDDITDRFTSAFGEKQLTGGEPMSILVTGIMSLFGRIIHAAIHAAAQSYMIAIVVITIMMIMLIGNFKLGLISMIPNLSPIIMVLGIMGWFGIPLDMFTMLVASIAIGLAVDDTVHFMYQFKRNFEKSGDVKESVSHTLHTAGRAMLTTSTVLAIGFFIFMFASMNNVFFFGILTGMAIIFALVADFFLAPALMALIVGKKERTPHAATQSAN